jgi:putative flippase GtrA
MSIDSWTVRFPCIPVSLQRFIAVGTLATALNFAVFLSICMLFSQHYAVASAVGYVAGWLLGYLLNRSWSFASPRPRKRIECLIYGASYLFSLVLSLGVLRTCVDVLALPPQFGHIAALGFSTVSNYLLCRYVIFSPSLATTIDSAYEHLRWDRFTLIGFAIGSVVKLVAAGALVSSMPKTLFIPFMHYYLRSGLDNPYQHFFEQGIYDIFPYSSVMLWIFAFPTAIAQLLYFVPDGAITPWGMFLAKLPVFLSDGLIFLNLHILLPVKNRRLVYYYWLNPIAFYVCYVHGQLDAIPTALFLTSITCLIKKRYMPSFVRVSKSGL